MARRNPAFRIAIGGLTMAVVLCLVAAISLWKIPSGVLNDKSVSSAAGLQAPVDQSPIRIAQEGEVDGLLQDPPQRPVPEPQDVVEQPSLDQSSVVHEPEFRAAPGEPTEPAGADGTNQSAINVDSVTAEPVSEEVAPLADIPTATATRTTLPAAAPLAEVESPPLAKTSDATRSIEVEIAALKGQINELARTQLQNQLEEIRHAEQLLTNHQSTRMIEALQREVDELKAERLTAVQSASEAARSDGFTEPVTSAPEAELPLQNSEPVVETAPLQNNSIAQATPKQASTDSRVRYTESTETPGRYDVEADEASLQEFIATLGPVAGWNLVSGPELTGNVTLRWSSVDLRQALTQQLKARGWQIREEGDFAIIESFSLMTARHMTAESTIKEYSDDPARAPITLKLAPGAYEGSTYDQSTGIRIQPGTTSRSVPVSRSRHLFTPNTKSPPQTPVQSISTPSPASATHQPESAPAPLLMKAAPAPVTTPAALSPSMTASTQDQTPVLLPPPSLVPPTATQELTPVVAVQTNSPSPTAKIDIDVTIIETLTPHRSEQGILSQSIDVTGRGDCPTCGQKHSPTDIPSGHASEGWFEMSEGIRCGVSSMTPEEIITQLQQVSHATVTSKPHAQVLSQQVAEIGLTEKQGFRRINIRQRGENDHYALLQGGVELALRPTLEENGVIRLDLTPIKPTTADSKGLSFTDSSPATTLSLPPGHSAVIGGMYFGIEPPTDLPSRTKKLGKILTGKFSDSEIREVVVVVRVLPSSDSEAGTAPASLTTESQTEAPAPLLIPASASPIPQ